MYNHYAYESKLDEASNCWHEERKVDDNLQREDENQRPQHQRKIIAEPFDSQRAIK